MAGNLTVGVNVLVAVACLATGISLAIGVDLLCARIARADPLTAIGRQVERRMRRRTRDGAAS